jgi:hypothetical protein
VHEDALLGVPQTYWHCVRLLLLLSHVHELVFDQALQVLPEFVDVRDCNCPVSFCSVLVPFVHWGVMSRFCNWLVPVVHCGVIDQVCNWLVPWVHCGVMVCDCKVLVRDCTRAVAPSSIGRAVPGPSCSPTFVALSSLYGP